MRHMYRGYAILEDNGPIRQSAVKYESKKPLCLVFGDPVSGWSDFVYELSKLPVCLQTFQRTRKVLSSKGVKLFDDKYRLAASGIVGDLLANLLVQVTMVDLLKALEIKPDFVLSSLTGAFSQAYIEGHMDLEKTVLCVYYIATVLNESSKNNKTLDGGTKLEGNLNDCSKLSFLQDLFYFYFFLIFGRIQNFTSFERLVVDT